MAKKPRTDAYPEVFIAGVDEAGRGPLAGPVYAAAVILDPNKPISGLADSKALSAAQRLRLRDEIQRDARAWAISFATVEEIDRLNILHATMLAMQRAVAQLKITPHKAMIDGNRCPELSCPAHAVIQGDKTVPVISAASILAKVTRDEIMISLDVEYPGYGFAKHKGYGTAEHLAALRQLGPCPIHRQSYAPVAQASFNFEAHSQSFLASQNENKDWQKDTDTIEWI